MPLTRLEPEGVAESQRIHTTRTWTRAPGPDAAIAEQAVSADTLIATSRRNRTRRVLAGRVVACCQTTASNQAGQAVAVRVFGLAADARGLGPGPGRVAHLRALASGANDAAEWAHAAFDQHERVMRRYEQRLTGVLALLDRPVGEQQPAGAVSTSVALVLEPRGATR